MSTEEAFLGIDLGGSSCKAVLLEGSGAVRAGASFPYPTRRGPAGEVTQKPTDWEAAMAAAVRSCRQQAPTFEVLGMALTAPAHAVVLVDSSGRPLAPVLTAQDARPDPVARQLAERHGEEIFAQTMVSLTAGWSLAQLAWIAGEYPHLAQRTRWVLPVKDYLRFQLTGEAHCDPGDAAGTALYAPLAGGWQADLCSLSGFGASRLPPVLPSTAIGGRLSRAWARRTGLSAGIPVAIGTTDTAADLVSLGAREPGSGMVKIASTGAAVGVSSVPRPSPGTFTYPHVDPGRWYSVAVTSTAATTYDWLRAVLRTDQRPGGASLAEMDKLARRISPGSDGLLFLPYLEGERSPYWLRDLRGAFVGLSSAHSTGHICRAVLEGVAMSIRDCYEVLEDLDVAPQVPAIIGGGAESELWSKILAAVLGIGCRRVVPQGPAVGAALIAAEAVTGRRSAIQVKRKSVRVPEGWVGIYKERFSSYRRVAEMLVSLSLELRGS